MTDTAHVTLAAVQHCPTCSCGPGLPEPLYSLDTAALVVPTTVAAIKGYLANHPHLVSEPIYQKYRTRGHGFTRLRRMLTAADLHTLRAAFTTRTRSKTVPHAAQAPEHEPTERT